MIKEKIFIMLQKSNYARQNVNITTLDIMFTIKRHHLLNDISTFVSALF